MSYRTYINNTQVFGNTECYPEWIKYVESKGITVGEEGNYKGELDDFMEALDVVESILHRKKIPKKRAGTQVWKCCMSSDSGCSCKSKSSGIMRSETHWEYENS